MAVFERFREIGILAALGMKGRQITLMFLIEALILGIFGVILGNILGAQYYEAALKAHPEIPAQIEQGEFGTLHNWLTENIYQHGRKFTPDELVRATNEVLQIAA